MLQDELNRKGGRKMSQVQQAFIKCLPRGGQVLGTQSNLWPQGSLGEMFMMDEGKSE